MECHRCVKTQNFINLRPNIVNKLIGVHRFMALIEFDFLLWMTFIRYEVNFNLVTFDPTASFSEMFSSINSPKSLNLVVLEIC